MLKVAEFLKDWSAQPIEHLAEGRDADFVGVGSLVGRELAVYAGAEDDKVASLTPVTAGTRGEFWERVRQGSLVAYEGANAAILGVVKYAGADHIAYDLDALTEIVGRSFTDSDRTRSKQAATEETMSRIKSADYGPGSAVFVTIVNRKRIEGA